MVYSLSIGWTAGETQMKNFINGLVAGIVLTGALIANSITSSSQAHAYTHSKRHETLSVIVSDTPSSPIPMAKVANAQASKRTTSHRTVANGLRELNCYNYGMYSGGSDTVRICE